MKIIVTVPEEIAKSVQNMVEDDIAPQTILKHIHHYAKRQNCKVEVGSKES